MNVYNEDTLAFLIDNGATRVCLPGELSGAAVKTLCAYAKAHHPTVAMEVFAFGRQPLAISARCYHARANGLHKEGCRFACGTDPDGLVVKTLDGDPFVAINGVQTMADRYTSLIEEIPTLQELGVTRFRLSPHTVDMVAVGCIFRDVIDARINPTEGAYRLSDLMPDASFSNGFLHGRAGKDLVLSE